MSLTATEKWSMYFRFLSLIYMYFGAIPINYKLTPKDIILYLYVPKDSEFEDTQGNILCGDNLADHIKLTLDTISKFCNVNINIRVKYKIDERVHIHEDGMVSMNAYIETLNEHNEKWWIEQWN